MDESGMALTRDVLGLSIQHPCTTLRTTRLCLVATVAILFGTEARGEFSVCNRTFDIANVAVGWSEDSVMHSAGWWAIGPNQCANVIDEPLSSRYIYVFAQDVFGNAMLPGAAPLCVNTKRFEIIGERDCLLHGYLDANFYEVDTYRSERWSLFLNPPLTSFRSPDD